MEAELKNVNDQLKDNKLEKFATACDTAGTKMESFGKKMSVVSAGIAGIGAASIKAFTELDEVFCRTADVWGKTLNETSTPFNNMMELYFEDFDIDGLLAKYESGKYFVRYATKLTELAGGQKLVRLYDPSG